MMENTERQYRRDIGSKIMIERQRLKMSQKELGQMIGVSGQQMQRYENGISSMAAHKMVLCAKALGKPVGYFYGDGDDESVQKTSNILRLAAEIDQLPDEGMDIILKMMRNLNRMAKLCSEVESRNNSMAA
jgi:transcriptional regulator with XRE-family HTH domain